MPTDRGAVDAPEAGLWCDTFDADLLAVVPGAVAALGPAADLELHAHSTPTNGKINCPNAWHTDYGLAAFFSTRDRSPIPFNFYTQAPLVKCSFLEAVRDEWVHGQVLVINRAVVWTPPSDLMQDLACATCNQDRKAKPYDEYARIVRRRKRRP